MYWIISGSIASAESSRWRRSYGTSGSSASYFILVFIFLNMVLFVLFFLLIILFEIINIK